MVDRIKITPSNITIRDASNTVVFDTDFKYLKTDPAGNLTVGGYESCPTFYGGSGGGNISDKNNGWFPSYYHNSAFGLMYIPIAPNTSRKFIQQPIADANFGALFYSNMMGIYEANGTLVGNIKLVLVELYSEATDYEGTLYNYVSGHTIKISYQSWEPAIASAKDFIYIDYTKAIAEWDRGLGDPTDNAYNYFVGARGVPVPNHWNFAFMFLTAPTTVDLAVTV